VDATHSPQVTEQSTSNLGYYLRYLLLGTFFGIVLIKSEVISWYRIQEMFRFQGFHMYGIFATAILTGVLSVWLIRRFDLRSLDGEPLDYPAKEPRRYSYLFGGTIFGLGWGLAGACPGPVAALIGAGYGAFMVVLASAIVGTWVYGYVRHKLPH
jgi:uncharacterized membrane protein YedE/YeeE